MVSSSWRGREAGGLQSRVYLQTAHRRLAKPRQPLLTTHRPHTAEKKGCIKEGGRILLLHPCFPVWKHGWYTASKPVGEFNHTKRCPVISILSVFEQIRILIKDSVISSVRHEGWELARHVKTIHTHTLAHTRSSSKKSKQTSQPVFSGAGPIWSFQRKSFYIDLNY